MAIALEEGISICRIIPQNAKVHPNKHITKDKQHKYLESNSSNHDPSSGLGASVGVDIGGRITSTRASNNQLNNITSSKYGVLNHGPHFRVSSSINGNHFRQLINQPSGHKCWT